MKRFLAFLFCIFLSCGQAKAWIHGSQTAASGFVQLNLGSQELIAANFVNIFDVAQVTYSNPADAGLVDANGYLTSAPASSVSYAWASGTWSNTTYKLLFNTTRSYTLQFTVPLSSCSITGTHIAQTGACNGSGNTTFTYTGAGAVEYVTFTVGSLNSFSVNAPTTGTYSSGTGTVALYRSSDETRYNAGKYFTSELETTLISLHPVTIRPMGWVNTGAANNNTDVKWANRITTSDFAWFSQKFPPGVWAGNITGTDAFTSPSTPNTPNTWTNNEVLIGYTSNAATNITISGAVASDGTHCASASAGLVCLTINASATLSNSQSVWIGSVGGTTEANGVHTIATVVDGTHIAINVAFVNAYTSGGHVGTQTLTVTGKSGGAKFIANSSGTVPFSNFDTFPAGFLSCYYNGWLDRVLCSPGRGIQPNIPIEAQVQLANDINANLWAIIPVFAEDDYVTQWATVGYNNLSSQLYFYPEYSNELWNTQFPQGTFATQMGLAFGFPAANNEAKYGYSGTQIARIMGSLVPPVWSGRSSKLRRVLGFQAAGDSTILTYLMQGHDLAPSGTGTGIGNSTYVSFTTSASFPSGANYTGSAGSTQPANYVEVIADAPYVGGTNLCTGPDIGCTLGANNASFYQTLVNDWEASNTAGAIALINSDMNAQTTLAPLTITGCSGTTFTTGSSHGFSANSTRIAFFASGGTMWSGVAANTLYRVHTTPSGTTFTMQGYSGGNVGASDISCGSAGSGTTTVSLNGVTNYIFISSSGYHQQAESFAADFDASRGSLAPLRVEWYEGSIEPAGVNTAQCTTLGLTGGGDGCTTTIPAEVQSAIIAWLNDPSAATTIKAYSKQFFGTDSTFPSTFGLMTHSKAGSQLLLSGGPVTRGQPYSLLSGLLPNATAYQTFTGIQQYNTSGP